MAALAGIGLIRYTKSQQTAEMNASYSNHASMAEELQIALIPQRCSNGQGHALCGIAAMESGPTAFEQRERQLQGRAKKTLLSSVTHVPSGLIGCALAA